MPRTKGQLTQKQLDALAAGRAARASKKSEHAQTPIEEIENFLEGEDLVTPDRKPRGRANAKTKPEVIVTPEAAMLGGALLNYGFVRFFGEAAAMSEDEAKGIVAPLMRLTARWFYAKVEQYLPDGAKSLENGTLRELAASGTSFAKYMMRQVTIFLYRLQHNQESKKNQPRPRRNQQPATAPTAYDGMDLEGEGDTAPLQPDPRLMANGALQNGMASLAGIVPTDTGQQ